MYNIEEYYKMSNEVIKNIFFYNDYDAIDTEDLKVNTELFTKLDGVEIIHEKHPFISYIRGFVHNTIEIDIIHGWYHIESKRVKFYVGDNPSKYGDIIQMVWQKYWNNNYHDYEVFIYHSYCGSLYHSNEYEVNHKKAYAKIFKNIVDIMVDM